MNQYLIKKKHALSEENLPSMVLNDLQIEFIDERGFELNIRTTNSAN